MNSTLWLSTLPSLFSISCKRGYTDSLAVNFDPNAAKDDGSCLFRKGCTDSTAVNYDLNAARDDGTCQYEGSVLFYFDCSNNQPWKCRSFTHAVITIDTSEVGIVSRTTFAPTPEDCEKVGCLRVSLPFPGQCNWSALIYSHQGTAGRYSGQVDISKNGIQKVNIAPNFKLRRVDLT